MYSPALARMFRVFICLLALSAFAPGALAQWYAGGSLGMSESRYKSESLISDLAGGGITGTGTTGDSQVAGKLFAGYQIYDFFALEAGYFHLGDYLRTDGTYTRPLPASTFSGTTKGQGVNLDLVWTLPIVKSLSGIGRIGGALFRADPTWNANAAAFNVMSGAARKNAVIGTGGLGLQYEFTKTIAGRLEWQRYFNVSTGLTGGSTPIDLYTAGIVVKF